MSGGGTGARNKVMTQSTDKPFAVKAKAGGAAERDSRGEAPRLPSAYVGENQKA